MRTPRIVHIKRHSLEDGPGIRSVVFFKGCPLRCRFCHNPEAQSPEPQLAHDPGRCVGCRACVDACPRGAIVERDGKIGLDRSRCVPCDGCAQSCPSGALRVIGRAFTVDELAAVLERDRAYYAHSGGGVTFSGGETTLYPEFAGALSRRLKSTRIHLCLQTCGHFDFETVAPALLALMDVVFFDVKLADPARHAAATGADNAVIWGNLARVSALPGVRVVTRTPLIAGTTDDEENLSAIAARVRGLGLPAPILLRGHSGGAAMRGRLGME